MNNILHLHTEHVEANAAHKKTFRLVALGSSPMIAGYLYFFFLDFFTVANQGPVKFLVTLIMGVFMCLVCGALMVGDLGRVIREKKTAESTYLAALRDEMVRYGIDPETVDEHTSPDQQEYLFSARLKGRKYEFCVRHSDDELVFFKGGYPMQGTD